MGPSVASQQSPDAGPSTTSAPHLVDACAMSTEELVAWCRDGQQLATPSAPSSSSTIFHPELRQFASYRQLYASRKSRVWLCKDHSGQPLALKCYIRKEMSMSDAVKVSRELSLFKCMEHPNIIKGISSFLDDKAVYLLQEYAENGDLCDIAAVFHRRCVPEHVTREKVIKPLITAIAYLHSRFVMHRDIKPENVLITGDCVVKLCDFGLAINWQKDIAVSRVGTLEFMAPEIIWLPRRSYQEAQALREKGRSLYTSSVDIWAIGILAYELLYGRTPFNCSKNELVIEKAVRSAPIVFPLQPTISVGAANFIKNCLERVPMARPTADNLLVHEWFTAAAKAGEGQSAASGSGAAAPPPASSSDAVVPASVAAVSGAKDGSAAVSAPPVVRLDPPPGSAAEQASSPLSAAQAVSTSPSVAAAAVAAAVAAATAVVSAPVAPVAAPPKAAPLAQAGREDAALLRADSALNRKQAASALIGADGGAAVAALGTPTATTPVLPRTAEVGSSSGAGVVVIVSDPCATAANPGGLSGGGNSQRRGGGGGDRRGSMPKTLLQPAAEALAVAAARLSSSLSDLRDSGSHDAGTTDSGETSGSPSAAAAAAQHQRSGAPPSPSKAAGRDRGEQSGGKPPVPPTPPQGNQQPGAGAFTTASSSSSNASSNSTGSNSSKGSAASQQMGSPGKQQQAEEQLPTWSRFMRGVMRPLPSLFRGSKQPPQQSRPQTGGVPRSGFPGDPPSDSSSLGSGRGIFKGGAASPGGGKPAQKLAAGGLVGRSGPDHGGASG